MKGEDLHKLDETFHNRKSIIKNFFKNKNYLYENIKRERRSMTKLSNSQIDTNFKMDNYRNSENNKQKDCERKKSIEL
jgi:hypothetical protein